MDREFFQNLKADAYENFFSKSASSCAVFERNGGETLGFPFGPVQGERVIFYPGSFSPWHKGHIACLRGIPRPKGGEKWSVVIAPDFNPWKKNWKEVNTLDLRDKILSIWLSLERLSIDREDLKFHLYLGFLVEPQENPTALWMRKTLIKERWLLLGEDTFLQILQWTLAEDLINNLKGLFVVPRMAKSDNVNKQIAEISKISDRIDIQILEHHKYEHFSSTFLRKSE